MDSQIIGSLLQSIDVLKIDLEGYEQQVLKGSTECLRNKKNQFIYLENGLDDRLNSFQSIMATLSPCGYQIYGIYEQTPHWTRKQNLWYWNTLFANAEIL